MRNHALLLSLSLVLSSTLVRAASLSQPLRAPALSGVSSPVLAPALSLRGGTAAWSPTLSLTPTLSLAAPALTLAAPALVAVPAAFIPAPIILAQAVIVLPAPQSAVSRAAAEADFFSTSWRSLSFKKGGKGKMPDPKTTPDGNGTGEAEEGPLDPLGNPSRTTDDGPDTVSDEFPSRGGNGAP